MLQRGNVRPYEHFARHVCEITRQRFLRATLLTWCSDTLPKRRSRRVRTAAESMACIILYAYTHLTYVAGRAALLTGRTKHHNQLPAIL